MHTAVNGTFYSYGRVHFAIAEEVLISQPLCFNGPFVPIMDDFAIIFDAHGAV
jgi:hypothetical protein